MASRVYSAVDLVSGLDVALKAYNLREVSDVVIEPILGEIAVQSILGEAPAPGPPEARRRAPPPPAPPVTSTPRVISALLADHPHIMQLWAVFRDRDFVCVIMPLATNGDLYSRFKEIKHDERSTVKYVLLPMISAVGYLHERGIYHRDIKLENVLLDKDGKVQLADFGFSMQRSRKRALTQLGTLQSMAPEVILCDAMQPDGPKRTQVPRARRPSYDAGGADVWALGVMFWELLTGTVPFNGRNEDEVLQSIYAGTFQRPELVALSPEAQSFMSLSFLYDPNKRARILDLYAHPLVTKHVSQQVWTRMHPSPEKLNWERMEQETRFRLSSGTSSAGLRHSQNSEEDFDVARDRAHGHANYSHLSQTGMHRLSGAMSAGAASVDAGRGKNVADAAGDTRSTQGEAPSRGQPLERSSEHERGERARAGPAVAKMPGGMFGCFACVRGPSRRKSTVAQAPPEPPGAGWQ